jgi:hypothetical protein
VSSVTPCHLSEMVLPLFSYGLQMPSLLDEKDRQNQVSCIRIASENTYDALSDTW